MQNFNTYLLSLNRVFKTALFGFCLIFMSSSGLFAQCDIGDPDCENSPIVGFPYTTNMLDFNSPLFGQPIPGCNGGATFHNTTWYRVIPTTPFLLVDIVPSGCQPGDGGQLGIQAAMYPVCDPNATPVGTIQCDCTQGSVTVGGVVTPGVPYYIMVDGCSGSFCQLDMSLQFGEVQTPPINLGTPTIPIPDIPLPTCPGAEITFIVPPVNDADVYTWNFPPGVIVQEQDCNEVTVIWGPNEGDVFVTVSNNTNGDSNTGPPLFVTLDPPTYDWDMSYCSPEFGGAVFYGDGIEYTEGMYTITVPGIVCDTIVNLNVMANRIEIAQVVGEPISCSSGNELSDPLANPDDGVGTVFMVNHGGGPYTYQWEYNTVNNNVNTNLPAGFIGVTVTDSRGCTAEDFVEIEEPDYFFVDVNFDPAPSCASSSDGQTVIITNNGVEPFTYVWGDDGSTDPNRDDISPGVYELTVTDANGCVFEWVGQANPVGGAITANELVNTPESCPGAENGAVTLEGVGANPPFTFIWSDNNLSTDSRNDLAAGTYEVTIIDDSGCEGVQDVVVTGGNGISIDATTPSGISCFGDADGSLTVTASGGQAPLTISVGSGTVAGNMITGLTAGDYTLVVTDAADCEETVDITIPGPDEFLPTIANTPVSCGGSNDGTVTVTPVGGTGPFTYVWDHTTDNVATLNGLGGGTYNVNVTDVNGCTFDLSTELDGGGSLVVNEVITPVGCNGESTGSISVNVVGATGTVTYEWDAVDGTNVLDNLAAGDYELYVEDGIGCNNTVVYTVPEPDALDITEVVASAMPTSCNGGADGQAEVSVTGGDGSYTFSWSTGETDALATQLVPGVNTVTVMDGNMCSETFDVTVAEPAEVTASAVETPAGCNGDDSGSITISAAGGDSDYTYSIGGPFQTSNVFNGLAAGNYSVVVNDGNSCDFTFAVEVTEPAVLSGTIASTDVSCSGEADGTATLTPAGGQGPYTVTWSNSMTGENITGLSGGAITGTIEDANGCTISYPVTIEENSALSIQVDGQTQASCDGNGGGSAFITVNGGQGPYTYNWSDGTPQGDGSEVTDLNAGMVTVVVTDADNCTQTTMIDIEAPQMVMIAQDVVTNINCNGESTGSIAVSVSGGSGTANVTWTNTTQTGLNLTGLPAGTYEGTVLDNNGCTDQIAITLTENPVLTASAVDDQTTCDGQNDGETTITAGGGDGNYTYDIGNGPQASNVFTGLAPNTYMVNIIDGLGCATTASFEITAAAAINSNIVGDNVTCNGANDGTATVTANGGTGTLEYYWDGSGTPASNNITGLTPGLHEVEIRDGNGCSVVEQITITEPDQIQIAIDSQTEVTCNGVNDGTATASATGGNGTLTYLWDGTINGPNATGLSAGMHTVVVTDGNNCTNSFDIMITEPDVLEITAVSSAAVECFGETNGTATVNVVGGDSNYTVTWDNGETGLTATTLGGGNRTATVVDGNGCTDNVTIMIDEPAALSAAPTVTDVACFDGTTGEVEINVDGGTAPFEYTLNGNTQMTNVFSGLGEGNGIVIVQDANGCSFDVPFTVTQPDELVSSISATPVSCNGAGNGTATVVPTGGTAPYNVTWNNPGATTGLTAGGFDGGMAVATITDQAGCIITVDVMVDEPVLIELVEIQNDPVQCNGENQGLSTVEATGGTGTITYEWIGITQVGPTADQLQMGMYTVVATDAAGCTEELEIEITEPVALSITLDATDVLCNGATTGSATVEGVGGVGGYQYEWTGGPNTPTYDNIPAGDYVVMVTDGNGCTQTLNVPISEPSPITYDVVALDLVCNSVEEGSITIDVNGGEGPYSYTLNGTLVMSNAITGLAAGDYDIEIIDANGCIETFSQSLTQPDALQASVQSTMTNCFDSEDGTAIPSINGGVGPYTTIWNGTLTAPTGSDLPAGTNTVEIIDANGCSITESFQVEAPSQLTFVSEFEDVVCNGENSGTATVTPSGGTVGANGYQFDWSPNANGQITAQAVQLTAGTYTVTITDDGGCTQEESFTIGEPQVLEITNDVVSQATCGAANGSVEITVEGGLGTYQYDWSGGTANDNVVSELTPGNVSVIVTDGNGCTVEQQFNVSEPGALTSDPVASDASCLNQTDGEISLNVSGGGGSYTYAWEHDGTLNSGDLTSLAAGVYNVTVTDADDCTITESITIDEPAQLTAILNATQSSCGGADGTISLVVDGGNGGYTYAWDYDSQVTQNLTDVPAGMYEVTITDAMNCNIIETVEVTNPDTPVLDISGAEVLCFGESTGSISLSISGGSGGETIDWNGTDTQYDGFLDLNNLPAGMYDVVVTDNSMCSAQTSFEILQPTAAIDIQEVSLNQATCGAANGSVEVAVSGGTGAYTYTWSGGVGSNETVTGLTPGNVVLTVADGNGCEETATFNVSEPDALQVSDEVLTMVDCNGGTNGGVDITVTGGTMPYTFNWGPNGANEDLDQLGAGTYELTITDGSGCSFEYSAEITQPEQLTAVSATIDANCGQANGVVNVTVEGGTAPFIYQWDAGSTDEDLTGVEAGIYELTITDANLCQFIISDEVVNPNPPVISATSSDVTCFGTPTGTVSMEVTGGSGVYTYDWSDDNFDGEEDPSTLPAGVYTVVITDSQNCSATETFTINEPQALQIMEEAVVPATCGNANGSVDVTVIGGTQPYTFDWGSGVTTEDLQNATPGTYVFSVIDGNNCETSMSFDVLEPDALVAVLDVQSDVSCPNGNNGAIEVTAQGGNAPYTYSWSNAATTEDISGLTAGLYTLTLMDADNCEFTLDVTIEQPQEIAVTGTTEDAQCGAMDGSISIDVEGGTAPYTFNWDNGSTSEDPTGLAAGLYNLVLTDANGCNFDYSIAVSTPNELIVVNAFEDVSCNGGANGTIDLTISGGVAPYTIDWDNDLYDGSTTVNDLPAGVYTIVVIDDEGCEFPSQITIAEPDVLDAFVVDPQSSTLCNGSADGSIELVVNGGTTPYDFQWTNGAGTVQSPENLAAGTYDVVITDGNGCTTTQSATIVEPLAIALAISADPASCNNTTDGSVTVSANGGTGEFTYSWNSGAPVTDETLADLAPGFYTVVVADQNGCTGTINTVVTSPEPVVVNLADISDISGFNTSCNESTDGFLTVNAAGGNSNYTYEWADGTSGETLSELGGGNYTVVATDQEGCTGEGTFPIVAPPAMTIAAESDAPDCYGETNGMVVINGVEGGAPPYRYSFNNNSFGNAQFFGNLASGNYPIAVQDANGCETESEVTIDAVAEVIVNLGRDTTLVLGDSLLLTPQFNIPITDSSYVWSLPLNNDTLRGIREVVQPLNTTMYSIEVTDEFGCKGSDEIMVTVEKPRLVYIPNAFNPESSAGNDRFMVYGGQDVAIVSKMEIFNRWGEIIYRDRNFPTDTPSRAWDGSYRGQRAPMGVYVYVIEVVFLDGHTEMYTGDVTIVK